MDENIGVHRSQKSKYFASIKIPITIKYLNNVSYSINYIHYKKYQGVYIFDTHMIKDHVFLKTIDNNNSKIHSRFFSLIKVREIDVINFSSKRKK